MEPGSDVPPTVEHPLFRAGMLLRLGHLCSAAKQFSLTSRTRGILPAGWQPTALRGRAAEGKWHRSTQAGALGG